jgi:hypothetical protein
VTEERRPVYSESDVERRAWTDERLDDLADAMRTGFDRVDGDIRELRQTMTRAWITMISVQMVGFLGVIATILARGA